MVFVLPPPASNRGDQPKSKAPHSVSRVQPSGRDMNETSHTKASSRRDPYDESRYSQAHASDAGTMRGARSERRDQITRKAGDQSETVRMSTRRDDEPRDSHSTARDPYDSVRTRDSHIPPSRSHSVRDSSHHTHDAQIIHRSTSRAPHDSARTPDSHLPSSRSHSVRDSGHPTHSTVRDPYDSVRTGGASEQRTETVRKTEERPASSRRMDHTRESHRETHRESVASKARTDHHSSHHTSRFDERSAAPSRANTVRESTRPTERPRESHWEPPSNVHGTSQRRHELPSHVSRRNSVREPSRQTLAPYDSRGLDSNSAHVADDLNRLSLNSDWDRTFQSRGSQSLAVIPRQYEDRVKHLPQKTINRVMEALFILGLEIEDMQVIIKLLESGDLKSSELVKFAKWGKKNDIFSDFFSGKFNRYELIELPDSDDDDSDDDDADYRLRRKDRGARYTYYEKITIERVRVRERC